MYIRGSSQYNSDTYDQTYSFFMASMPLGFLHQIMAITYIDWTSDRMFHFFRWGITYDNFSVNLLLSSNPKRVNYDISEAYLPSSLAGFGNSFQLMLIYNH